MKQIKAIVASVFKGYTVMVAQSKFESVEACSTSGNLYNDDNRCSGYVWSRETGFKEVPSRVMTRQYAQNANGTWENSWGFSTEDLPGGFKILVVLEDSEYSDCNGRDEESHTATIFKLDGDEAAKLEKAEKAQLIRQLMELL